MIKRNIIILFIALFCCVLFCACNPTNNNLNNVELVNSTFTYTGSEISPAFSYLPSNCQVQTYHNGKQSEIINAGTYIVKVTKGKTIKKFEIIVNKCPIDIICPDIIVTYGESYSVTPQTQTEIAQPYSFETTFNGSTQPPVNSGTYNIETTLIADNYTGSAQSSLTINKANSTLQLEQNIFQYNGQEINLNYLTNCPENYNITQSNQLIKDAGNYQVTATLESSNYYATQTFSVIVNPKPINISLSQTTFTYSGEEINIFNYIECSEATTFKLETPTLILNAGTYEINILPTSNNYTGTLNAKITINQQPVQLDFTTQTRIFNNSPQTYQTDSLYNYIVKYNNSTTPPTNAGTYDVSIEILNANFCGSCQTKLVIEKQQAQLSLENNIFTYTGNEIQLSITPYKYLLKIYQNGTETTIINAGEYQVEASIQEDNYCGTSIFTVTVQPKPVTISIITQYAYTGSEITPDIELSESVSYSVEIYYNGTPINVIKDAGTYQVKITTTNSNYSVYLEQTINVNINNLQDKINYALTKLMQINTITATGTATLSYGVKDVEFSITKTYTKYENSYSYYEQYHSNYVYEDSKVFFLYSQNNVTEFERTTDTNKTFANNITENRDTNTATLGLLPFEFFNELSFQEQNNSIQAVLSNQQKEQLSLYYSYLYNGTCVITNAVVNINFNENFEFSSITCNVQYTFNGYEVTETTQYSI